MKRVSFLQRRAFAPMVVVAAAGVFTVPTVGAAQQETTNSALEEVVVTARKRSESLQQTPVAISAMTGAMLETAAVRDLSDASRFVPNLSLTKGGAISGSNAAAAIFIRGVGQGDFIVSSDPGVGIYIDGVYYARMVGASLELTEVERVEVLRGPQGTLFGRNTIGGAISILSKQPEPQFSAYTSLTAGENEHYGVKAGVNFPLSDTVYARVNGLVRQRGGYVDALQYDDVQLGDEEVKSVRGQLRFDYDRVDVNLSADYTQQNDHGAPWVAEAIVAPGADPTFNYLFASFANLFTGDPSCQSVAGQTTNPTCFGPVWVPRDRFATNNTFRDVATGQLIEPYSDVENFGASLTVEADLGFAQFKSISAWSWMPPTRALTACRRRFFSTRTPLQRTPDYQGNVGLTYTIPLSAGDIALGADWSFMGEHALYSDNAGHPYSFQDAWTSGNVSVSYIAPDDRWRLTLHAENVTDEAHKISAIDVTRDTFGIAEVVYNRPREVFATLTFNF